jgi:hypothetical protein
MIPLGLAARTEPPGMQPGGSVTLLLPAMQSGRFFLLRTIMHRCNDHISFNGPYLSFSLHSTLCSKWDGPRWA